MIKRLFAFAAAAALAVSAMAQAPQTEGEVRKVDKAAGKVTLKHGEIKNLEMPAMTMVFTAKDPALLDKVKVRFQAEKEGTQFVVTALEVQR